MIYADPIARILPALNAATEADLVFWTEAGLYEYLQEAAQRVSRFALFAETTTIPVEVSSGGYLLPNQYRAIAEISLDGKVLRPASIAQLEALSSTWVTDTGIVALYVLDAQTLRLWRIPTVVGTLGVLYFAWPTIFQAVSDRYPQTVGDVLTWHVIADARSAVGDGMAPDVVAQAKERIRLYESVIEQYWGKW